MNIEHSINLTETQALAALADVYPFTMVLDVEPVDGGPHWHSFDAEFHILSGDLTLTDADGRAHPCKTGTRVVVPQRTIHAERSEGGYRIALGTSTTPDNFGEPVDRPVSELDR